jgi:hypothetical protein
VLSGLKGTTGQSEVDVTTATAHLPGLTIEIVHHRPPGADREEISIKLQAVPSFEAYGRFLEAANPFVFWAEATRLTWFCWLEAARAVMLPSNAALSFPMSGSTSLLPFSRGASPRLRTPA